MSKTNTPETTTIFSHPTEQAFTKVLDFYGIQWIYEPRTFPIAWDDEDNVIEAFSPDFYLPDQDLYIELTTLRPKLSTNKNRKLRLMQELYPEINIKLFKRRELRALMLKFGLEDEANHIQGTAAQKERR